MADEICLVCGGSGKMPFTGKPCPECAKKRATLIGGDSLLDESGTRCAYVPSAFSHFDIIKSKARFSKTKASVLENLYNSLLSSRPLNRTMFIVTDDMEDMQCMVFDIISQRFAMKEKVFPLFDGEQLYGCMQDVQLSRPNYFLNAMNARGEDIYDAGVLFVKLLPGTSRLTYVAISQIVSRRSLLGKDTVFLCSQDWDTFVKGDKDNLVSPLKGTGVRGSIQVVDLTGAVYA